MSAETADKGRARRATTPDELYLDRPSSEKASTIHWSVSPYSEVVCDLASHTANLSELSFQCIRCGNFHRSM